MKKNGSTFQNIWIVLMMIIKVRSRTRGKTLGIKARSMMNNVLINDSVPN